MPEDLWHKGQPGEKTDERDEQCVATRHLGKTKLKGGHDYACKGYENHYTICEI